MTVSPALNQIPRTAENHFSLYMTAAVCRLLDRLAPMMAPEPEQFAQLLAAFPVLARYFRNLHHLLPPDLPWSEAYTWWEAALGEWERGTGEHLPLRSVRQLPGIGYPELLALMLIGAVEEHAQLGQVYASLDDTREHRPSFSLVARLVSDGPDPWAPTQPLLRAGLIEIAHRNGPRAGWAPRVPLPLWEALRGSKTADWGPGITFLPPAAAIPMADLLAPPGLLQQLQHLPALLARRQVQTVVLRSLAGGDALGVMGALAASLGRGLLHVEATSQPGAVPYLGPLCTVLHAIPVLVCRPAPGETVSLPPLRGHDGPVGVLTGHEGAVERKGPGRTVVLDLPMPDRRLRLAQWKRSLAGHPVDELDAISGQLQVPEGHIRLAAGGAIARAGLSGRTQVTPDDVREAARSINRQQLDLLATRLDAGGSWTELIVSPPTLAKLRELELRCKHREELPGHLSPAYSYGTRGVRALFSGPSGTGKTLAAKILAAVLQKDLYRVEMAAVVSKYIGETEKNLSQVLARAEELDVILLLDEGDSLLARRSDVTSANDRHANLQTNYLLQRLEHYQGIALVTTNASQNIDIAFQRRMDVVVDFLPPQAGERLQIWRRHLPRDLAVAPATLEEIAARCLLTGGQIRNAALTASLLALDEDQAVTDVHLIRAVQSEYRKSGALDPLVR